MAADLIWPLCLCVFQRVSRSAIEEAQHAHASLPVHLDPVAASTQPVRFLIAALFNPIAHHSALPPFGATLRRRLVRAPVSTFASFCPAITDSRTDSDIKPASAPFSTTAWFPNLDASHPAAPFTRISICPCYSDSRHPLSPPHPPSSHPSLSDLDCLHASTSTRTACTPPPPVLAPPDDVGWRPSFPIPERVIPPFRPLRVTSPSLRPFRSFYP